MNYLITKAIAEKSIIDFMYDGYRRIAEPHVYGILHGMTSLLVYQVAGGSSNGSLPNWRRVMENKIYDLVLTDNQFPGKRPYPSGKHSSFDQRIAFVA